MSVKDWERGGATPPLPPFSLSPEEKLLQMVDDEMGKMGKIGVGSSPKGLV